MDRPDGSAGLLERVPAARPARDGHRPAFVGGVGHLGQVGESPAVALATLPAEVRTPTWGWRFRPHPRTPSFEEERRFRDQIRSALRVASGGAFGFAFRWTSGPTGGVRATAGDPAAAAWFRETVLPAYPPGHWVVDTVRDDPFAPSVRFGGLAGPVALPLPFAVDRPPWSDAALLGLTAVAPGVDVVWELRPGRVPNRISPLYAESAPTAARAAGPVRPALITAWERAVREGSEARRSALPWGARVEVRARGASAELLADRVAGILSATVRLEGGNGLRFLRPMRGFRTRPGWILLSEPEMAGIFPAPWVRSAGGPESDPIAGGLPFGIGSRGRRSQLPIEPDQGRHVLILGETGMGKSSLLIRLLTGAVRWGSVLLLDPIGDTGRRFLAGLTPELLDRVTWISPTESPVGLNALRPVQAAAGGAGPSDRALHELVAALRRVRGQHFSDPGFWGPRIEEVLTRTLALAARLPRGTLVEAHELLALERSLPFEVPSGLRGAVESLRGLARERPEEVAGSRRVLGEIARNRVLRRMLCDAGARYELKQAGEPRSITVITGEAPVVGEATARQLLSVDLALVWSELLARPRPEKVFLALDEAQWYAHDGLLELLRLGRRGNIHVWTATQALRSMGPELHEALVTNSADLILFRGDPEEAHRFSRWAEPLTVDRLSGLPRGQAAVLIGKGNSVDWVAIRPLPPAELGAERRGRARQRTLARWGSAAEPEETSPAAPPSPGPARGTAELRPDASLRTALLFVRELLGQEPPGHALPLSLPRLREFLGLDSESGRALGSELKRSGLLLRSTTDPAGTVWWLQAPEHGEPGIPPPTPQERPGLEALLLRPAVGDIRRDGDKGH